MPTVFTRTESVSYAIGMVFLVLTVPIVGGVIGTCVLWDAIDRLFRGRPLDGLVMSLARWVNKATHTYNAKFVKNPEDSFIVNTLLLLGVFVPSLCAYSFWHTLTYGWTFTMCFIYHILRIGPYFMNFAYAYVMCHKEGHSQTGFFAEPHNRFLKNIFNWWVGLFYGVMPSSFAYGHSINHHKYNNGPADVISTGDKARDEFSNYVAFVPRFFLYALNVSTVKQFLSEGQVKVALSMVAGSVYWIAFVGAAAYFSPLFAVTYLLYPLFENILLLSCINWVWHGFIDPKDPENPYVNSVTIHDGPINVLEEDYHVVHHQYPGVHWTKHEDRYNKHFNKGEYRQQMATAFRNTHVFELFFMMILRDYDSLTSKWVDYSEKLTKDEIKQTIIARLRGCWWGPRALPGVKLAGSEIGNFDTFGTGVEDELQSQATAAATKKTS